VNNRARALCTVCAAVILSVPLGCGPSLARPSMTPAPVSAFVEVPYPPPAAHAEVIPPRPHSSDVWIDGQWSWDSKTWRWEPGRWVVPPAGAKFQPWMITRSDARVLFAPATWRDADGREVAAPPPTAVAGRRERTATK
jgi:hypothetical protein